MTTISPRRAAFQSVAPQIHDDDVDDAADADLDSDDETVDERLVPPATEQRRRVTISIKSSLLQQLQHVAIDRHQSVSRAFTAAVEAYVRASR